MNDLSLKLDRIHDLVRFHPRCLSVFKTILTSLLENPIPQETVMITIESRSLTSGMCEIVALVGDDNCHLGRQEKYSNCIYSQFSGLLNRVVILENVTEQSGYLSLDDRVMSEIFFEYFFSDSTNLILNAEFSSSNISEEVNKWFGRMTRIFLDEE